VTIRGGQATAVIARQFLTLVLAGRSQAKRNVMPELRALCFPLTPTVHVRGRVRFAIAAATLLALAGAAVASEPAALGRTPTEAEAGRAMVITAVAGIVSYTRWPAETTSIRFCTLGQGRGVDELLGVANLGSAQLSVPVRAATSVTDACKECEVIYVGALASNATREVLQRTVGRPVLVIGEGQDFCSDGGMFCLHPGTAAVRFTVNLDAIARSGLRVNPWVLRIARNAPASGQ